jgi:hypothetical protein
LDEVGIVEKRLEADHVRIIYLVHGNVDVTCDDDVSFGCDGTADDISKVSEEGCLVIVYSASNMKTGMGVYCF